MFDATKYLQNLINDGTKVTVFLMNGFQMHGIITGFDHEAIEFYGDGTEKLIYRHAISTIEPRK